MPSPAPRQPEESGNREPAWKSTRRRTPVGVLRTENAGRIKLPPVDPEKPANLAVFIGRGNGKKSFIGFGTAAPVEMGMGVEDLVSRS